MAPSGQLVVIIWQLGDGTEENRTNPVQVLNQDGSVFDEVIDVVGGIGIQYF